MVCFICRNFSYRITFSSVLFLFSLFLGFHYPFLRCRFFFDVIFLSIHFSFSYVILRSFQYFFFFIRNGLILSSFRTKIHSSILLTHLSKFPNGMPLQQMLSLYFIRCIHIFAPLHLDYPLRFLMMKHGLKSIPYGSLFRFSLKLFETLKLLVNPASNILHI